MPRVPARSRPPGRDRLAGARSLRPTAGLRRSPAGRARGNAGRECSPPAREPARYWLARRSTIATSIPANANSPANISPVGPPPAITTACSGIRHSPFRGSGFGRRFCNTTRVLRQPPSAPYNEDGKECVLLLPSSAANRGERVLDARIGSRVASSRSRPGHGSGACRLAHRPTGLRS